MSLQLRSLFVKEWSERRQLFLFGLGLMALYLGYCIAYEIEYRTRAFVASYYQTCMAFGWLGSVLLAMSTATGEYSQRTLRFSASLPVSLKTIAWVRLLGAWFCLVVPMLIGAVLVSGLLASGLFEQAGLRPVDYYSGNSVSLPERPSLSKVEALAFLWSATAIAVIAAIHSVTLISLVGTFCRSEGTVGFLGAIVLLFLTVLTSIRWELEKAGLHFARDWIGGLLPASMAISWGYQDIDGSSYADLDLAPLILGPLFLNGVITMGMGIWFARQYGCRADLSLSATSPHSRRWLPRTPNILSWVGMHWPGRIPALVWLDARQSVPLGLAGLMIAALITLIGLSESSSHGTVTARMMGGLPSNSWFVGMLWGAIIAVGIFSSELKPGLEQFWRSRPISPTSWFWTKFGVGLAALLLTLDIIPALLAWRSVYQPQNARMGVAYIACIPLLHTLIYALAVAAVCRLRRPIPAAIAALVLFFLLDQILESIPIFPRLSTMNVYNKLHQAQDANGTVDLTKEGYPLVYGIVAGIVLVAIAFARRMVVPAIVGKTGAATLMLAYLPLGQNVQSAEPPSAADIVAGMRQREELVHNLHLQFSTRTLRTAAFFADVAEPQSKVGPRVDQEERKRYEFYDRSPCRAWTESDADGQIQSIVTYDGTVRRDYHAGHARSRFQGNVTLEAQTPSTPFIRPDASLASISSYSVSELIGTASPDAMTFREEGGEKLVDIRLARTFTPDATRGSDQRFQITVNLTRNYWPVRTQMDMFEKPTGRLISRNVITARGWIETGAIAYPKSIEQQSDMKSKNRPADSDELVPSVTQTCDVEFVEINGDIPDTVFDRPFPPGSRYYDSRDSKWYEVDAAGGSEPHAPQPKGVRGAVLAYHLLWISGALIYRSRRPRVP